jgi:signal transduction histidine kinase
MSLAATLKVLKQTPVFVPGAYAVLASLWIFFSDRVLASLVDDPARLTELQTYKGWFFVATTTALLALLIHWRQRALNELNVSLEQRVLQRTAALQAANQELARAMDELKRTQSELVRSEKLAALGALVAGVAHELNTPIGNSLMVASSFSEDTGKLAAEFAGGGLRKSAFEDYVKQAQQASELLVRNLSRAGELVSSFKQVAVDRTSSRRREFQLAEVVNEILTSMRPGFKRLPIIVSADVSPAIALDSYPGPLGQVLGNLVDNAIIHGLAGGREGGRVEIAARQLAGGEIELKVSDNGDGIPVADRERVFDPFFTTRFGQGGSGLGLHIVHHLVTQVLGGRIVVKCGADTAAGVGAEFIVVFPSHAAPTPTAG